MASLDRAPMNTKLTDEPNLATRLKPHDRNFMRNMLQASQGHAAMSFRKMLVECLTFISPMQPPNLRSARLGP